MERIFAVDFHLRIEYSSPPSYWRRIIGVACPLKDSVIIDLFWLKIELLSTFDGERDRKDKVAKREGAPAETCGMQIAVAEL